MASRRSGQSPRDPQAARTSRAVVEAVGLTKVYGEGSLATAALDGVDLQIRGGEMVAIMGPSGCGKTTLLNCISGLDEPTSGRVRLEDTDLFALSDKARTLMRAQRMGFVFQSYNLLPVLTAAENVEIPLLVAGVAGREARRRSHEALSLVGLAQREDHRPKELSGGEQQRVAIARALVHSPAIVWADEPTGNLDATNSADVMRLLDRLNRELATTFVIVTHDPDVAAVCHRTIQMGSGRVVNGDGQREASSGKQRPAASGTKRETASAPAPATAVRSPRPTAGARR